MDKSDDVAALGDAVGEQSSDLSLPKQIVTELVRGTEFRSMLKGLMSEVMDEKLAKLNERIDRMEGDIHTCHVEYEELKKTNAELLVSLNKLSQITAVNHNNTMDLEQKTVHRNSLRITGIPESEVQTDPETRKIIPEDTIKIVKDMVKDELEIDLTDEDLDSVHREKRRSDGKPRSIIANFTRNTVRNKVLSARRKLKGTHKGVQEVLSFRTQFLLDQAKDMCEYDNKARTAWSWNGIVTILVDLGGERTKRCTVTNVDDIRKIARKYP